MKALPPESCLQRGEKTKITVGEQNESAVVSVFHPGRYPSGVSLEPSGPVG